MNAMGANTTTRTRIVEDGEAPQRVLQPRDVRGGEKPGARAAVAATDQGHEETEHALVGIG